MITLRVAVTGILMAAGIVTANAGRLQSAARTDTSFTVASSSVSELLVDLHPKHYAEAILSVDGHKMTLIDPAGAGSTAEAGKPALPTEGFVAALPPGMRALVDVVQSQFEVQNAAEIAPAPAFTFDSEGEAVAQYHVDQAFYDTHNDFYPSAIVELGDAARLRDLSVVKILVSPCQYNPVTKQLKRFTFLRVRVRFVPSESKSVQAFHPVATPDPEFDPVYRQVVLNYRDASQWRTVDMNAVADASVDSAATWFHTGRTYYRIPVIKDGLYRLSYNTLLGFGIDLSGLDNRTAAVYFDGTPQPVRVVVDSAAVQNSYLEFYAHHNYGVGSYFNRYNDTSAYWLAWNDAAPRRFTDAPSAVAPTDTAAWYIERQWNEKDLNYFFGVTQDDLLTTEDVKGEGWYWADFNMDSSKTFPFTIDSVQRKTGLPAQLRLRLNGMTICTGGACTGPSRHEAALFINRVPVGVVDFTQNSETLYTCTFPDSILRKGNDTLTIKSIKQASNISKFYMDWFEVSFPRPLLGLNGALKFTAAPSVPGPHAFRVNGLPADSTSIYDLSNGRRISTLTKIGPTTFLFSDTISAGRDYILVKDGAKLAPASASAKQFTNLRQWQGGADYIVITHNLFRQQAERLAAFRKSQNRLRTAVVDVQDIYDEFNYGHLDPVALKSFLKYAYYQWSKPALAYVLFFGDASWDFKKNMAGSVKDNFVPAYGNPPSDNALVSFDPTMNYMPYMLAGRLPVSSQQEAQAVVDKVVAYERAPVGDWSRSYMFLTDGNTSNEKLSFNFYSDQLANSYVIPPPIGGQTTKVYKATDAIIDGESKPFIQQRWAEGLVMVNFIGHSGGRIWGMDIGSPYQLQNTNGMLPFVASVSCNVGFFSDPRSNVLSEDFVLAENRGAIACWAASSLGYATVGRILVDKFLSQAAQDYSRNIGLMTTVGRMNFWIANGRYATPLVMEAMNLHPLIGDPYTHLAIPTKPDMEAGADDIVLGNDPPLADSVMSLTVHMQNQGLAAGSPISVKVSDSYTDPAGHTLPPVDIAPTLRIPDFTGVDSFSVAWNSQGKPGMHSITVNIDPDDSIPELNKSNNIATRSFYVYRNSVRPLQPLPQALISTTAPVLVTSVPAGQDTTPIVYNFEIDTTLGFNSPAKISSGPVTARDVSASWKTPSLQSGRSYFWRSQNATQGAGPVQGAWSTSSFTVSPIPLAADTAYWQQTGRLFNGNTLERASVTDTGLTMMRSDSTTLFARSLGYRADQNNDYYSIITINTTTATGWWWDAPYSFLAGWYNSANGTYVMKGFNFLLSGETENMTSFLKAIPDGNYVILSAVRNARVNITDSLKAQIKALGGSKIDSLLAGQSYILISQKGVRTPIVQMYKASQNVEATVKVPNFFRFGSASVTTTPIGPVYRWGRLSCDLTLPTAATTDTIAVLGLRNDNSGTDTLKVLAPGVISADLSNVDATRYPQVRLSARLSCSDGASSPTLKRWTVAYLPPADPAISAWSFHVPSSVQVNANFHVLLDVYNTGQRIARNTWVSCSLLDDSTQRAGALIDTVAPGSVRHLDLTMNVNGFNGTHQLIAAISPRSGENELSTDNNVVMKPILLTGAANPSLVKVLFDNVEIRDGDFVSPKPVISLEFPPTATAKLAQSYTASIDGTAIQKTITPAGGTPGVNSAETIPLTSGLSDGNHILEIRSANKTQSDPIKKITFQVASKTALRDLFNYPNPFPNATLFTFVLTGAQVPNDLQIKIFTVAGRVIRTLHAGAGQLQIGVNRIPWDGRDEQGDELANGYYFYKVMTSANGEGAEAVQRLVKLR